MGKINPKHFDWADSKDTRYSFVNYDLYAKTGLSIRKNFVKNTSFPILLPGRQLLLA